jgi:hypothetical protein
MNPDALDVNMNNPTPTWCRDKKYLNFAPRKTAVQTLKQLISTPIPAELVYRCSPKIQ